MNVVVPTSLQQKATGKMPAAMGRRQGNVLFHVEDEEGNPSTIDEQAVMDDAQKMGYQVSGHSDDGMQLTLAHPSSTDPVQIGTPDLIQKMGYKVTGAAPRHANYDAVDPKLAALAATPGLDPRHREALIRSELKDRGDEAPSIMQGPKGEFFRFDPQSRQYQSLTHTAEGHFGADDIARAAVAAPRFVGSTLGAVGGAAGGFATPVPGGTVLGGAAGGAAGGQAGDLIAAGTAAALSPNARKQLADMSASGIAEEQLPKAGWDAAGGALQGGISRLLPGLAKAGGLSTAARVGGGAAEATGNVMEDVGGYVSRAGNAVAKGEGTLAQNLAAQTAAQAMGGPVASAGLAADLLQVPGGIVRGTPRAAGWLGGKIEGIFPELSAKMRDFGARYAADTAPGVLDKIAAQRAAMRAGPWAEENLPAEFRKAAWQAADHTRETAMNGGMRYDDAEKLFDEELQRMTKGVKDPYKAAAQERFGAEESAKLEPYKKLLTSAESTANAINRGIYGTTGAAGSGIEMLGKILGGGGRLARRGGELFGGIETPVEIQLGKLSEEKMRRRRHALQALGIPSNMDGKSSRKPQLAAN